MTQEGQDRGPNAAVNAEHEPSQEPKQKIVMSWKVHPVKRKPWLSAGITIFILMMVSGVFYMMESAGFAGLAMVVMFASLAKFYFPTNYEITDTEIIIKTTSQTLRKEWKQYRSCYPDKNGVFLSPFVDRSRLENFRGLYLLCNDNVNEVAQFARTQVSNNQSIRAESGSGDIK